MEASMLRNSVMSSHLRHSCLPLGSSFTGKPGALHRRAINQRSINSFRRVPVAVIDVDAVKMSKRPSSIPSVSYSVGIDENKPTESFFAQLVRTAAKTVAVVAIAGALLLNSAAPSLAARSGGRVGGSSFSSARSSGSSSYSTARSGGGSYGSSLGGGSYSRGALGGAPAVGFSFFGPSYGYGYGGYGYGGYGGGGFGGGGLISVVFWGLAAVVLFQVASNFLGSGDGPLIGGNKLTVTKLQVGLLGSARSLQAKLDRIAGRADTNTPEGLNFVLQETVLALLRNPEYAVYGSASVQNVGDLDAAEQRFNSLSLEERRKFEEETLVNVGGRTRRGSLSRPGGDGFNELIVVTVLVAAQTGLKLPKIRNREELAEALNALGGLAADQVLAVEVLWTPQEAGDYYTRDEVIVDYPTLNSL